MEKYDTSQLTEFPRFEPETVQSGVSTFFNKLWRFPLFSPSEPSDSVNKTEEDKRQPIPDSHSKDNNNDNKPDPAAYAVEIEGRSLPNVLRRISSLIALGSGGGTRYEDTELARYWMPDDISRECYECATRFSALRRRHHCRVCGQIFCNRCCSQRVPGQIFGCAGGLRVCTYCCNVVLSYLRENELSGDMTPDLRTLQENLQVRFPDNKVNNHSKEKDNFIFASEPEERRLPHKEVLQDIFRQLLSSLPTQQHRYRLVRYSGVWRGCDVLQWVMEQTCHKSKAQAMLICQNFLNEGYMEGMSDLPKFADYALYKPKLLPQITAQEEDTSSVEESNRLVESVSSYCLDLNLDDSSARLTKAPKTENKSPSSEEDSPVIRHTEPTTESQNICKAITECGEDHLKLLLRQCLSREGLHESWLSVIYPLCQQAAQMTTPEPRSEQQDVRAYVQVKKVAGGRAADSRVVGGVALSKHVAHRAMAPAGRRPRLLLLGACVRYQRVPGRRASLEPLLLQEQEHLMRCAARISALNPTIVLVQGSVARTVQDALRKDGVSDLSLLCWLSGSNFTAVVKSLRSHQF